MLTETVDACPVCRSPEIRVLSTTSAVNICTQCGFAFDSPRPTTDEIVAFYSRPTQYDGWIDEQRLRDQLWARRLAKMLRLSRPGSLLDIGAGIGQFLHHAQPHFDQVAGTEVSSRAIEVAKERYGFELLRGQVEDFSIGRRFDNITMFHVLEHVPDPARAVARCVELLEPRGVLFIAVPNELDALRMRIKRLLARAGIRRYSRWANAGMPRIVLDGSLDEIHLSHFTASSLRLLLERSGLAVLDHGLDPYSIADGSRRAFDELLRHFSEAVLHLTGRNIYDAIWMVAQKPE